MKRVKRPEEVEEDEDVEMVDVSDPEVLDAINAVVAENKTHAPTPNRYRAENEGSIEDFARPASPVKQTPGSGLKPALVLDTNFLISHLPLLDEVRELHPQYGHVIVVPWIVIQELDGLKESKRVSTYTTGKEKVQRSSVSHLARKATNWIYKQLAGNSTAVKGQKLTEINDLNLNGDDAILDCCRYFQKRRNALTVILSNDKNLCTKSLVHGVRTISFAKDVTARRIVETVRAEADGAVPEQQQPQPASDHFDDGGDAMYSDDDTMDDAPPPPPQHQPHPQAQTQPQTKAQPQPKPQPQEQKTSTTSDSDSPVAKLLTMAEDTFLTNVKTCIDIHMHKAYDGDGELEYFGYTKDSVTMLEDSIDVVKKFKIAVFSNMIPGQVISKASKAPPMPITKEELLEFIDSWGAFWIYLSKDAQKTQKVQQIVEDLKSRAQKIKAD
ncbi:hypothetical protein TRICI_003425 [Trichomonascus ciferrii]|uniref:Transcriptional protein SWT1 n=1 Tax=Trichomonascus ciferrii TaxID=44093 RepID=A0A642V3T7_9ASCO|nr:hypothetical protein TRICI_003425 [Trichomonascus ciferrii]